MMAHNAMHDDNLAADDEENDGDKNKQVTSVRENLCINSKNVKSRVFWIWKKT